MRHKDLKNKTFDDGTDKPDVEEKMLKKECVVAAYETEHLLVNLLH